MNLRRNLRFFIVVSYALQTLSAAFGAACLWLAIDLWLTGSPFGSALETSLAFLNGYAFVNQAFYRARLRTMLHQLDRIEKTR